MFQFIRYETVTQLSKEILDLTDEENFEIEYEKNSDFDMYYHERHIELAKFIKDKEGMAIQNLGMKTS